MALFGDWNGDGKNDCDDTFIEYMIFSGALDGKNNQKRGGGGCLLSAILMISPFIGAILLIGKLIA